MDEVSITQRLGRLLIVGLVCSLMAWGAQFLPYSYQPSRPLYALAWFTVAAAAYMASRHKNQDLASIARVLSVIFFGLFLVCLLMRN